MIDLHKVHLRNGMLQDGFSASFGYLGGNETSIVFWIWDAFTATCIKPGNDPGVGLNDKIEIISAEKGNLFLQETIQPDFSEIRGYKSDVKSILTFSTIRASPVLAASSQLTVLLDFQLYLFAFLSQGASLMVH